MKSCFLIKKIDKHGSHYFTGQWKYGTNPMYSSDIEKATCFVIKKEADDYNRTRQLDGIVYEHLIT